MRLSSYESRRLLGRLLLTSIACLYAANATAAGCKAPPYFPVRNFINPEGSGGAHIWVPLQEFTLKNVICLVQTLRAQQSHWKRVVILLFTSEDAAENFDPSGMSDTRIVVDGSGKLIGEVDIGHFRRELRALWELDEAHHKNELTITPMGLRLDGGEPFETRIELPVRGTPHCRLQVNQRCLLALPRPVYPLAALAGRASVRVTLNAVVERNGVTKATIAAVKDQPSAANDPFERAALDELATWWFEPAPRQDSFRITFSYSIDPTLARRAANASPSKRLRARGEGSVEIEFGLPTEVKVRGYPAE